MTTRCQIVTYHGKNKATFACPSGHKFRRNVIPAKGNKRHIGEAGIQRMISWWSKTGVNMNCPKCGH